MSSHLFPEISCHLLAVTPTRHWLEYVDWAAPVLAQPLEVKDSCVTIPSTPGTGVVWDEKAVKKYAA
jgi:mandelate racemase